MQYYENQRYEDCIRAAREALKINPNLAEAYANIATAYHTMGKWMRQSRLCGKQFVSIRICVPRRIT